MNKTMSSDRRAENRMTMKVYSVKNKNMHIRIIEHM